MALTGTSGPTRGARNARRSLRETVWVASGTLLGAAAGRLGAGFPKWAWVSGTMIAFVGTATWLYPLGLLMGLGALKQVLPQNAAVIGLSVATVIAGLVAGSWRDLPKAPAFFFGAFALVALPTVHTTLSPWDTIQTFTVPSTTWELYPARTYEIYGALSFVGSAALALLAARAVRSRDDLEKFMLAICVGAIVPIAFGLFDKVTGNFRYHDGNASVAGIFGHPNAYAVYLTAVVPLIGAFAFSARDPRIRRAAAALCFFGVVCLFLTFTRGAWVALALAAVVSGVLAGRVRNVGQIAVVLIIAGVLTGTLGQVTQRFSNIAVANTGGKIVDSWTWRTYTWGKMIESGGNMTWTGNGFASYPRRTVEVFGQHGGRVRVNLRSNGWQLGFGAHNDFVQSLVENGIPGLVLWCGFLISMLVVSARLWLRRGEPLALGVFMSTFGLTVMSFSDNVRAYSFSWFVVCGALAAVYAWDKRNPVAQGRPQAARTAVGA